MATAVFDVDGTLVSGPGTERDFFHWLLRRGYLGPRQLLAFLWFNVRWFGVYGRHTFKKNKAYLAGLDDSVVAEAARVFVGHIVPQKFYAPCVGRVRAHLAAGDRVILLSGTLLPIANAISQSLGIEYTIATRCDIRGNVYTSAPPLVHPFGAEKRRLLDAERRRAVAFDVPVFSYCDSGHDIPLLDSVDSPVCVRPDRRLRAYALARRWDILDDSSPAPIPGKAAQDYSGEGTTGG